MTFDSTGNMYFSDATCKVVYKVAEDRATAYRGCHVCDQRGVGKRVEPPAQAVFTNVPGTQVNIIPAGLRADLLGNLYVGENTGSHVWFWDVKTGNMHTVFGGPDGPGNCYGVGGSSAPYNGCDGQDSRRRRPKGTPGLALDAWGNLYIADSEGFYVHKLALGTNAPAATVPAGFGNALVHFGAGDGPGSVSLTAAPDFAVAARCAFRTRRQHAGLLLPDRQPTPSLATRQYEQAVVTVAAGCRASSPLTNQAYPVCQPPGAASEKISYGGATSITLSLTPGGGAAARI